MVGTPPPTSMPIAKSPNVDERRNRAAMKLPGARPALKFRPHRHADRDFLSLVVDRDHFEAKPADEKGSDRRSLGFQRPRAFWLPSLSWLDDDLSEHGAVLKQSEGLVDVAQ